MSPSLAGLCLLLCSACATSPAEPPSIWEKRQGKLLRPDIEKIH